MPFSDKKTSSQDEPQKNIYLEKIGRDHNCQAYEFDTGDAITIHYNGMVQLNDNYRVYESSRLLWDFLVKAHKERYGTELAFVEWRDSYSHLIVKVSVRGGGLLFGPNYKPGDPKTTDFWEAFSKNAPERDK